MWDSNIIISFFILLEINNNYNNIVYLYMYRPGVYRPGVIHTTKNNVVIQSSNVSRERVCESSVPITEATFPRCTVTDRLCSK